jgi:hypothetical protein
MVMNQQRILGALFVRTGSFKKDVWEYPADLKGARGKGDK